jgi:hypothetical protein
MAVDVDRALEKVSAVLARIDRLAEMRNSDPETYYGPEGRGLDAEITEKLPVVVRIAGAVDSVLPPRFVRQARGWEWGQVRTVLLQLRGLLQGQRELEEILGPTGPQLVADRLHPWVWNAAAQLWDDGHRREAIQAAATQVEIHLQAKLGRSDISGVALVREAFTLDPPASGRPRLRFANMSRRSQAYRNAHEGAGHFGAGCFQAIRNPVTHQLVQPDEAEALERLAALSILARWVDLAVRKTD